MNSKIQQFDFVQKRKPFFLVSAAIIAVGIVFMLLFGLNLGVDFQSGTNLDIQVEGNALTVDEASQIFADAGFEGTSPTVGGSDSNRVTNRFAEVLNNDQTTTIIETFEAKFGEGTVSYEENTVDAVMAKELSLKAIYAVSVASIFIILYVTIRFEWRFALAAILAIVHDAMIVISIFAIFRFEINLVFIAAILTIIGYSINDTIVIFDRIRENVSKTKKLKTFHDLATIVNNSIMQTLARSINTAVTVIFAAGCLLVLGSPAIKVFSLAILIGLISGAYSSIFIASPIWLEFKKNSINKPKKSTTEV
ncbi:protein translocase subunit SecF [Longirhabdus pacifica]|uniref:protein translocase subunit SecF n=1 Tax=Longirhabdus pacifica TaxID=2305227 RepID=UPI001008B1FB|nr:protein translocase subunit SecF [Longirhabdus pacifica]